MQGLSDVFSIRLQNDVVQDIDVRWDQALLSAGDMPSDGILEGLFKSELQDSAQFQTVLALYHQETVRNNGQTSYLRQKRSVKLHIDQTMTTRKLQSPERSCGKRSSHQESNRNESPRREESRESVSSGRHMDNVQKETHVVSVMTQLASGNSGKGQRPMRTIVFSRTKFEGQD